MARPKNTLKFTVEQVEAAIRSAAGLVTPAAKLLSQTTGTTCSPQTIRNYITRYKRLQDVIEEIREATLDLAETRVKGLLKKGDPKVCMWYLDRLGQSRGFGAKHELSGPQGSPLVSGVSIYLPAERDERALARERGAR